MITYTYGPCALLFKIRAALEPFHGEICRQIDTRKAGILHLYFLYYYHARKTEVMYVVYTDSTKINRPGHNIRMY